jgi:SPP1 gp7 family putative phage head morphogenesis protein
VVFFYAQNQPLKFSRKIMNIKLNKPFAANSAVDEFDVKQVKKALNRLGYYQPYEKTGITGIPDADVFSALKSFQKNNGLQATGTARPGDETVSKLSSEAGKKKDGKYIWRTVGDSKVRKSHSAMNGTIRDLSDSPDPGEEINCRCWAEPVNCDKEFITQNVTSDINDAEPWSWIDYANHYWNGGGEAITLSEIGYLGGVIGFAEGEIFPRVSEQVAALAREIEQGPLYYTTERDYKFNEVSYPLGGAVVISETVGSVEISGKCLIIDAEVTYNFSDTFTDILSIRQKYIEEIGTSDPNHPAFDDYRWTEFGGTYFDITGSWTTKMSGIIKRANKGSE